MDQYLYLNYPDLSAKKNQAKKFGWFIKT